MKTEDIARHKHKTLINSVKSHDENVRLFRCFREHLSTEEAEIIVKYWAWLNAIAEEELTPITEPQKDFVRLVKGQKEPTTIYEKVWKKITQLQNKRQMEKRSESKTISKNEILAIPFDPILRSQNVECRVMQGNKRCYYRFRFAKFYGGIVTADTIGCNLLCAYCWNYDRNLTPTCNQFYNPREVAECLLHIAEQHQCEQVRISGAEPFLGEKSTQHLIEVIQAMPTKQFIIETNGIILGIMPELIERLKMSNIHVRVTVKGDDERVTGIKGCLDYQLNAIKNILQSDIKMHVAIMPQLVERTHLEQKLLSIGYSKDIEEEELITYEKTEKLLKIRGVLRRC